MPERATVMPTRAMQWSEAGEIPPPDIAEFIRFCHRRRAAAWPELYDEMCAVAARREFNGWDQEELAAHGLTFSLFEMPRLVAWVRATLPVVAETSQHCEPRPAAH